MPGAFIPKANVMGCRCAERRQHITAAAKAAVRGDMKAATDNLRRIVTTVRADARDFGSKVASARASLARR
jgi:hypothetical protein